MRWRSLVVAFVGMGCVAMASDVIGVAVYQAPLDAPPARRAMPSECRLVHAGKRVSLTELDMQGQKDPYHVQRREAAAAGANALLVLSKQVISRHDPDCPGASPITDCPPGSGAWFDVVFESYACPADVLERLSRTGAPPATGPGPTSRH
jgi:hypothetical protein